MLFDNFVKYFEIFILVFMRIQGLFISAPFYSGAAMPASFKLALGFFTSLISVPLVIGMGIKPSSDLADLGVKMLSNFIFGAGIGFFVFTLVSAFQVSAQIFSMQMGLGMNEVFDPISDTQVPAIGNVLGIMITLLLLRVDGQFYLLQIVIDSFRSVDLISVNSAGTLLKGFLSALMGMFEIGLKISMPIIGATIMLDIAMGLISRVAPQFNVMIMGFNVKLFAGFFVIWLVLPAVIDLGSLVIADMLGNLSSLVNAMKT
jgi:flagellar biosynthetic protein FliR